VSIFLVEIFAGYYATIIIEQRSTFLSNIFRKMAIDMCLRGKIALSDRGHYSIIGRE
jgi:hypothetical protein